MWIGGVGIGRHLKMEKVRVNIVTVREIDGVCSRSSKKYNASHNP